jgi:DNA-binding MarR family transcriptional regulator
MKTTEIPSPEPLVHRSVPFYCADDYQPEESLGYLMRQILNTLGHEVEQQLAHTGLTNAQWIPLFKLFIGRAKTAAELARDCQLDAGAMTRLLDRLEAKGLCRRERSASDRRVITITLTEAGLEAARQIPKVLSRVQNANLDGFSEQEFQTLKSFLRRILKNANSFAKPTMQNTISSDSPGGPHAA